MTVTTDTPTGAAPMRSNGHQPDMHWPTLTRVTDTPTATPTHLSTRHTDTPAGTAPTHRQVARDTTDRQGDRQGDRHTDRSPDLSTGTAPTGRAIRRVLAGVSVALGFVILAPLALSGQDLYRWASSANGLNLDQPWPWFVPVALDLAAAACIGMTIVAVWRRERAGAFGLLVWGFGLVSAYGQSRHGVAERAAGRAQDLWWAMPAFAVLGPLLLEITLNKIRLWARKDAGEQHNGAAGFGKRWIPGVAFRETLSAWAASRREGIAKADEAIQFVRDRKAVAGMSAVEACRYAFGALGTREAHAARVWLSARHVSVTQADLDAARGGTDTRPMSTARPVALSASAPTGVSAAAGSTHRQGVDRIAGTTTGRVSTDRSDTVAVDMSRRAPKVTKAKADRSPRPKSVAAPTRVADTPVGGHSAAAVANAADLRRRYVDVLPSDYQIRQATKWSADRVKAARAALEAGADVSGGT